MQHSKERTTVHTIVLTEKEAAWLREVIGKAYIDGESDSDDFLTDLYDSLAP